MTRTFQRVSRFGRQHDGHVITNKAATSGGAMPASTEQSKEQQPLAQPDPVAATPELNIYHYLTFFGLLAAGLIFLAVVLYFTSDSIGFQKAMGKVVKRLGKTVALRQLGSILAAMAFVRYGLEPLIKNIRTFVRAQGSWEKSSEYYIIRELYKPLEFLFLVAALTTLAENFLPQLIAVPKSIVQTVVKCTLSLTFVIAAARVVFNIKGRIVRESAWQLELKGDLTRQRRIEAFDKLLSVLTLVVTSVFGLQAIGLDVNSVLAIGGVGGLAVGLAGREILENLFTGLIILSSNPFEVGDEVMFRPSSGQVVEGIVVDVGWYRTTIRSFEREIFNIPNSVFLRNVVLNITRKQREWRFFEFIPLRVEDLERVNAVVSDIRKILRQDSRIIQKLHRRVFLDKITKDDISIYISFYVEATNRDAFMAVKQDLLLAFVDCVERNGSRLARNRLQIQVMPAPLDAMSEIPIFDVPALPPGVDFTPGPNTTSGSPPSPPFTKENTSASNKDTASNIVPSSSGGNQGSTPPPPPPPSGSGGKALSSGRASQQASAAAAAAALLGGSNPAAVNRAVAAVRPDAVRPDAILPTSQEGQTYIGSFDECSPGL